MAGACWLLHADHQLAPLRRSRSGSNMPIRDWLLHADLGLAPIWRSVTALPGLDVEVVACGQNGLVMASMTLLRVDIANAAVAVIDVVPTHEFSRPGFGLIQAGEAFGGKLGAVLGGAEQRFGVGVVVAD